MRHRLLPSPVLTLALMALWLMLNDSLALGHWLMAALLGVGAPLFTRSLRPTPVRLRRPTLALRLMGRVVVDMVASNLRVLRGTLAPTARVPVGGFVTVPLDLRDPTGLAVLSVIMCVIPGTIWAEMAIDRSALLLHLFDMSDPEADVALIKSRYERPLMEIFE